MPGVTPAEVQALAALTLHTTDDLLRVDAAEIAARAPGLTTARVTGWQSFAALAEIDAITPEAAAAFRAAGADTLSEFAFWPLAKLRTACPGIADDVLVGWQRDAVRLDNTGVLNGTVRLRDGTPVEGASVTVDGDTLTTDARGRFRARRLALDRGFAVTVHHDRLGHKLVQNVRPRRSAALVGVAVTLAGRRQAPKVLSALRGDRLPATGTAPITTRAMTTGPDRADILMLIDTYANGDARLASRFLDFEEGRFVRRTCRMPDSALPAGMRPGDDMEWTGTLWALARYSAAEIAATVRMRRLMRTMPVAPPQTDEERLRRLNAMARAQGGR